MEKFRYKLPDGHTITLPKLENVPLGIVRKTRKLEQGDMVFTMLEMLIPEESLEHLDSFDRSVLDGLMTAWKESSEASLGESSAS